MLTEIGFRFLHFVCSQRSVHLNRYVLALLRVSIIYNQYHWLIDLAADASASDNQSKRVSVVETLPWNHL